MSPLDAIGKFFAWAKDTPLAFTTALFALTTLWLFWKYMGARDSAAEKLDQARDERDEALAQMQERHEAKLDALHQRIDELRQKHADELRVLYDERAEWDRGVNLVFKDLRGAWGEMDSRDAGRKDLPRGANTAGGQRVTSYAGGIGARPTSTSSVARGAETPLAKGGRKP